MNYEEGPRLTSTSKGKEKAMKARLLYLLVALAMVGLIPTGAVLGQAAASVTWNLVAPDTTNPSAIVGNVTGQPITGSNFYIRDYTGTLAGPLNTFMRWWPGSGVSWGPETLEVATRYIQLVAAPKAGNSFAVDSVTFWSAGGGTSTMKMNLYYSTDPTFSSKIKLNDTAIVLPHATNVGPARFAYKISKTVPNGQSFYFRIYPWYTGAASTSKYVYTQLAVIKGTTSPTTEVGDDVNGLVPSEIRLYQNYPNPFNPSTTIKFGLAHRTAVKIAVYNILGEQIRLLVSGENEAGMHEVQFAADGVPSGVYFVNMKADGFSKTITVHLIK